MTSNLKSEPQGVSWVRWESLRREDSSLQLPEITAPWRNLEKSRLAPASSEVGYATRGQSKGNRGQIVKGF